MTRKEVDSEEYKMVYEVDYLFLEEYGGQQQENDDEIDGMDMTHKDIEASPEDQTYTDSL